MHLHLGDGFSFSLFHAPPHCSASNRQVVVRQTAVRFEVPLEKKEYYIYTPREMIKVTRVSINTHLEEKEYDDGADRRDDEPRTPRAPRYHVPVNELSLRTRGCENPFLVTNKTPNSAPLTTPAG
jgi:hypothetical protein